MRSKARFVIAGAALLQLAGCSSVPDAVNPISWYRGITGASKNDELGSGQNEQNLKEGSNEPYPNLGSVPDAPDTALSSVDRDKLVNSLIADRNNAKYSAEDLRAGRVSVTAPPPAPPAPAAPQPAPATSGAAQASAPATPAAAPGPPPAPLAPAPATTASSAAPPPRAPPASASQQRAPARGSEAPPAESPVTSPTVKSVPQGESVTPAPPPPQIGSPQTQPPNRVATAAPPVRLTPPSGPAKPAAAPAVAPGPPTGTHRAGISYRVADVTFAPGSALLASKLRDTIAQIVKLHGENGGTIRIVGHGEAKGASAAITGLTLALDRAQAVAVALTDRGVAAKDISVEAAPVAGRGGNDVPRAEVYLEN